MSYGSLAPAASQLTPIGTRECLQPENSYDLLICGQQLKDKKNTHSNTSLKREKFNTTGGVSRQMGVSVQSNDHIVTGLTFVLLHACWKNALHKLGIFFTTADSDFRFHDLKY